VSTRSSYEQKAFILVVEDEPVTCDAIASILQDLGYSVSKADVGLNSFEEYLKAKGDFIVTNLHNRRDVDESLMGIACNSGVDVDHRYMRSLLIW
jgi:CheY-like chemotaxis protein